MATFKDRQPKWYIKMSRNRNGDIVHWLGVLDWTQEDQTSDPWYPCEAKHGHVCWEAQHMCVQNGGEGKGWQADPWSKHVHGSVHKRRLMTELTYYDQV